jgi:hypothetical protein
MSVSPIRTMFRVPLSCLTVPFDCSSALVSRSPSLGTYHGVGVPSALDSAHTTALRAIGHAVPDGGVSRAFFN